jgi:hypothetical protein
MTKEVPDDFMSSQCAKAGVVLTPDEVNTIDFVYTI